MTEADALIAIKTECKILGEVFTNEELSYFLDKYKVQTDTDTTYDIRRSIYNALSSAISTEPQSLTRGGVTVQKADLFKIRRMYAGSGTVTINRV